MAQLDDQIRAYEQLLPELKREHGSKWALLVDCAFKGAFEAFDQAARFARDNFPEEDWLIRHMDERPVTAPFLFVNP